MGRLMGDGDEERAAVAGPVCYCVSTRNVPGSPGGNVRFAPAHTASGNRRGNRRPGAQAAAPADRAVVARRQARPMRASDMTRVDISPFLTTTKSTRATATAPLR